MTAQEFVSCLRREVLEQNLALYYQTFEGALPDAKGRDTHWPGMVEFYRTLDEEQRRQFMDAIRQVMVDTLSNVLGILDGSSLLEENRDYFHLTYGDEPQELNGALQDCFLSPEANED